MVRVELSVFVSFQTCQNRVEKDTKYREFGEQLQV